MQLSDNSTAKIPGLELDEKIRELLLEEILEEKMLSQANRFEPRESFFRPVNIAVDGGVSIVAGFSGDISHLGIGLAHKGHIPLGEVFVEVFGCVGKPCLFRVEILWCNRIGEEWHTSGGRILELMPSSPAPPKLLPNEAEAWAEESLNP